MAKKKYIGSCECETVRFEAEIDLSLGTMKCNCRMCSKARTWLTFISPDDMKVVSGEENLIAYNENPKHHFCKTCGIKLFGKGVGPTGPMVAINLPVLENLDPKELCEAPIKFVDGLHDRFDRSPEFTGHL